MNLLLEALVILAIVTGIGSWLVATPWARALTVVHAVAGLAVLAATPAKLRGPVRTGMRRGRTSRWLSIGFGVGVLVTIGLGFAHSTGLWFGVGTWSALWSHQLVGASLLPLLLWHASSRPVRPTMADLRRRSILRVGVVAATATTAVAVQEVAVRLAGLAGGDRAGTGSHEIASFDPARMPRVSWLDDRPPDLDAASWPLTIAGVPVDVAELAARAEPLTAVLDCTGGWWSEQRWDVVSLASVVPAGPGRSIRVTSATGYSRLFANGDAERIFLATGYGGEPLRRGHGAALRVVAPGRRGPWWVKWVTSIERSDRPAILQLPLPPT